MCGGSSPARASSFPLPWFGSTPCLTRPGVAWPRQWPGSLHSVYNSACSFHLVSIISLPTEATETVGEDSEKDSTGVQGALGKKLAVILEAVVRNNDRASWDRLLRFGARCLRHPRPVRGGRRWALATAVNSQLREEADPPAASPPTGSLSGGSQSSPPDPIKFLASRVSLKLEEGDFKGAVRLACSEDTLADFGEVTFAALQQINPPPHPASVIPSRPQPPLGVPTGPLVAVSEEEVACAIQSFPNGSAGGPDGLRPQHLKDMINPSANDGRQALLSSLTLFIKLVLEGDVPVSARPYFFGANLVALGKKDGGVRPIPVGCTLRRLVAKVAGRGVMEEMGALLSPRQLGYGVKKGAESMLQSSTSMVLTLATPS